MFQYLFVCLFVCVVVVVVSLVFVCVSSGVLLYFNESYPKIINLEPWLQTPSFLQTVHTRNALLWPRYYNAGLFSLMWGDVFSMFFAARKQLNI